MPLFPPLTNGPAVQEFRIECDLCRNAAAQCKTGLLVKAGSTAGKIWGAGRIRGIIITRMKRSALVGTFDIGGSFYFKSSVLHWQLEQLTNGITFRHEWQA